MPHAWLIKIRVVVVENCPKASWFADVTVLPRLPKKPLTVVRPSRYEPRHRLNIPTIATLGKSLLGVCSLDEKAAVTRASKWP